MCPQQIKDFLSKSGTLVSSAELRAAQKKAVVSAFEGGASMEELLTMRVPQRTIYRWLEETRQKQPVRHPRGESFPAITEKSDNKATSARKAADRGKKELHRKRRLAETYAFPAVDAVASLSLRLEKFVIRTWIRETAVSCLHSPVRAVTFPGIAWLLERDLLLSSRVEAIVGLESDGGRYSLGSHNLPPSEKVLFLNTEDSKFFSQTAEAPFNLLWLDYMGPFSKGRLRTFQTALENGHIANKTLLCLTFINGRDNNSLKIYDEHFDVDKSIPMGQGRYNDARLAVIPEMYAAEARKAGFKTTVLDGRHYRERQGGCKTSPMLFFALLLEKKRAKKTKPAARPEDGSRQAKWERTAAVRRNLALGRDIVAGRLAGEDFKRIAGRLGIRRNRAVEIYHVARHVKDWETADRLCSAYKIKTRWNSLVQIVFHHSTNLKFRTICGERG